MAQNVSEWVPKPEQAKLLIAAQKPGLRRTILGICKEAGVVRRTFYRWLKEDAQFKAAWDRLHRASAQNFVPGVLAAMAYQAVRGDSKAARIVLELAGHLSKKVELTGAQGGPLQVQNEHRIKPDPGDFAGILAALQRARAEPVPGGPAGSTDAVDGPRPGEGPGAGAPGPVRPT